MWWPPKSEFFRNVWSWSGEVYWNSSMPGPLPPRSIRICWTTARGSHVDELRHEVAGRVGEGAKGERVDEAEHCSNQAAAASTFGTVMPMWSIPSRPGTSSRRSRCPFCFGDQSGFTLGTWYAIPFG